MVVTARFRINAGITLVVMSTEAWGDVVIDTLPITAQGTAQNAAGMGVRRLRNHRRGFVPFFDFERLLAASQFSLV